MIYIFSLKNAAVLKRSLGVNEKTSWIEILPHLPKGYKSTEEDQVYLDISELSPPVIKKTIAVLQKCAPFWGIVDLKGEAPDPAAYFFEGASDYITPVLINKGLDKKRFEAAFSSFKKKKGSGSVESKEKSFSKAPGVKLGTEVFKGWKSVRSGKTGSFFFLFVSLSGKEDLVSQLGERTFIVLKNRLRDTLQQRLLESEALHWMETEGNSLFLIPPTAANCKAAIEAVLKIILNKRLISAEKLGLSFPVDFTFALHYGQSVFQAPGKTGNVISESINYIYHLGMKKADSGRLTISGDVPEEAIPAPLLDLFSPAGVFEGIPIRHSKRFILK